MRAKDFVKLFKIGKGAVGEVYLARNKSSDKFFALKKISKARLSELNLADGAITEVRILRQIRSPFVVAFHASFQDQRNLYCVLEYARFGDLKSHLSSKQRFPEVVVRSLAAEILLGLEALHSKNIIYCDLKPENVLVSAEGKVMLSDFGHSQFRPSFKKTIGTCEYTSPEIILNSAEHFPPEAGDFWAFGILIYELMMGSTPFFAPHVYKMYQRIVEEEVRNSTNLSKEAFHLIQSLLEKNPRKRLGCGDEGVQQIKRHEFFTGVDWESLEKGKCPNLTGFFEAAPEELCPRSELSLQLEQMSSGFKEAKPHLPDSCSFENYSFQ